MRQARKQMHQTTIRFEAELWRRIDSEAERLGISSAQYIRDAALIRLTREAGSPQLQNVITHQAFEFEEAAAVISASGGLSSESRAVWAQARQARERAKDLRATARQLLQERPRLRSGTGIADRALGLRHGELST